MKFAQGKRRRLGEPAGFGPKVDLDIVGSITVKVT